MESSKEVSEAAESEAAVSEKMDDSVQFVPRRHTSLNVVPGLRSGPHNNATIDLVSPDRNATVDRNLSRLILPNR